MGVKQFQKSMFCVKKMSQGITQMYKQGLHLSHPEIFYPMKEENEKNNVNFGIGLLKSKIFEVPHDVNMLLTLTDNKFDFTRHKLPFDIIFIDAPTPILGRSENVYKTNLVYHGLLVFNVYSMVGKDIIYPWYKISENDKEAKEIRIMGYYSGGGEIKGLTRISLSNYERDDVKETFLQMVMPQHEINQLRSYVLNFLDFLNDPDVEFIHIDRSKKMFKKIKKGGAPTPSSNRIIVKNKLKRYINNLKKGGHMTYSHRFWVRGHWRTYDNPYFKKVLGRKQWIKPYIKGDGLLVPKTYELKQV